MGIGSSRARGIDKNLLTGPVSKTDERYFGLENFGNTCYANSVLQALYHCMPLRQHCIEHALTEKDEDDLLYCLCELFQTLSVQRKRVGVYAPKRFVAKLREVNELFDNSYHQDAHEFLNYVLNESAELLEKHAKPAAAAAASGAGPSSDAGPSGAAAAAPPPAAPLPAGTSHRTAAAYAAKTWVHSIFEGVLTSETRCHACETLTFRDESFLDLSLEVEQNSSVSACLRNFSAPESLDDDNKFFCDACDSLQQATKRMRIKRLPSVLALHLKRFKFVEELGRFRKLSHRIAYPLELKLPNVTEWADDPDRLYRLYAVIVHAGSGPNHGHYVALVRSHDRWLCFDDDEVDVINEEQLQAYFGSAIEAEGGSETGYLLFYESEGDAWTAPSLASTPHGAVEAGHATPAGGSVPPSPARST